MPRPASSVTGKPRPARAGFVLAASRAPRIRSRRGSARRPPVPRPRPGPARGGRPSPHRRRGRNGGRDAAPAGGRTPQRAASRSRRPQASPATGDGRCRSFLRGDVEEDAGGSQGDDEGRAAEGHEGQRDAGHGQYADDRAHVDDGLAGDPGRDPDGQQAAEPVGGAGRRLGSRTRRGRRTSRGASTAPTKPSSSPTTEKMKSVWALGRIPHFSAATAQSEAEEVARPQADERLPDLVARARAVGTRVEEGQDAVAPVGVGQPDDEGDAGEDADAPRRWASWGRRP